MQRWYDVNTIMDKEQRLVWKTNQLEL